MIRIEHPQLTHGYLKYEHLLGQEFDHGVTDCYTIPYRLFNENFQHIQLTNYARPDDWWENGMDLYMENFKKEGFYLIDITSLGDLRPLDCFLISLMGGNMTKSVTNHCGVYLGEGKMIHHRYGKLSQIVPYRGHWRNCTTAVLRHKDVPDLTLRAETQVDLMDYMLPHKREMLLGALNDKK